MTIATAAPGPARRDYRLVRPAGAGDAGSSAPLEDPGQQRILAHVDGPLLVIGGPGTGKTSTLVEAVAARVAEGADPEGLLAITYSRRGALRLRDRIEARLGVVAGRPTTAEPMVRTFPGYAFGLLRRAATLAGDPPPRLLTAAEADLVIRELLDSEEEQNAWPQTLRPALRTRAFATELRDLLLRAVERGIGPAELAAYARAQRRPDWWAAAHFYRQYRQVLALRDATGHGSVGYDAAELLRAATALLLDDPQLLSAERRRLSAVYVDEFADTDPAHHDLLAVLAGGGKHLVVFADPDSSTFVFRGADPAGVADFPHRFRTA
ncbi:MAG TPA: UvrD-helicase domain-containing protein, partial [Planosporangium sp.]|nr:UvrD-helicase domain-containing protein [Planosporangium sp.]